MESPCWRMFTTGCRLYPISNAAENIYCITLLLSIGNAAIRIKPNKKNMSNNICKNHTESRANSLRTYLIVVLYLYKFFFPVC